MCSTKKWNWRLRKTSNGFRYLPRLGLLRRKSSPMRHWEAASTNDHRRSRLLSLHRRSRRAADRLGHPAIEVQAVKPWERPEPPKKRRVVDVFYIVFTIL